MSASREGYAAIRDRGSRVIADRVGSRRIAWDRVDRVDRVGSRGSRRSRGIAWIAWDRVDRVDRVGSRVVVWLLYLLCCVCLAPFAGGRVPFLLCWLCWFSSSSWDRVGSRGIA